MISLVVIGGGGHAKVVISTLRAAGYDPIAVFDDDRTRRGGEVSGLPILGPLSLLDPTDYDGAVIAIGSNTVRRKIAEQVKLRWVSVVHPAAWVDPSVTLGQGTVVFAGAIVQPGTALGDHVIVNTGATVDHDCIVGNFAHIAPGSHIAGDVHFGEGVLLGVGSSVIPGRRIGSWAIVGAGSVVIRDIPDNTLVVGVPASPRIKVFKAG